MAAKTKHCMRRHIQLLRSRTTTRDRELWHTRIAKQDGSDRTHSHSGGTLSPTIATVATDHRLHTPYNGMTLYSCNNVSHYTENLLRAMQGIHKLDTLLITEAEHVTQFLEEFSPSLHHFLASFCSAYNLVPSSEANYNIGAAEVPLDVALRAAKLKDGMRVEARFRERNIFY